MNYVYQEEYNWHSHKIYVEGCGMVYRNYQGQTGYVLETDETLYFKKGEEEWGQPILLLSYDNNFSSKEILLYPNPTNGYLTIDLLDKSTPLEKIEIYSSQGSLRFQLKPINRDRATINIQELEAGSYFMKIYTNEGIKTHKIIKT